MPAWFFSPTGIMAAIIVALSISNVVFIKLYGAANEQYANHRAAVVAAQKQAEADREHQRAEQERLMAVYGDAWAAARRPVVRVLPARGCVPQAGPVSATAGQPDAPTAEQRLDSAIVVAADECQVRLENAVMDAAQVRWLEQWIKDQHEASK